LQGALKEQVYVFAIQKLLLLLPVVALVFVFLPTLEAGFSINAYINTSLLNTRVFIFQALGDNLLLMESALVCGEERAALSISKRFQRGLGNGRFPNYYTAKHHAAAGFWHQSIPSGILFSALPIL